VGNVIVRKKTPPAYGESPWKQDISDLVNLRSSENVLDPLSWLATETCCHRLGLHYMTKVDHGQDQVVPVQGGVGKGARSVRSQDHKDTPDNHRTARRVTEEWTYLVNALESHPFSKLEIEGGNEVVKMWWGSQENLAVQY
jgi:hypothetical protein